MLSCGNLQSPAWKIMARVYRVSNGSFYYLCVSHTGFQYKVNMHFPKRLTRPVILPRKGLLIRTKVKNFHFPHFSKRNSIQTENYRVSAQKCVPQCTLIKFHELKYAVTSQIPAVQLLLSLHNKLL